MKKVQHGKCATWKKCDMENVQYENSRGVARNPQTSKMESFVTIFNGFVNYCCKAFHLRCIGAPGYTSGNKATRTKCNRK